MARISAAAEAPRPAPSQSVSELAIKHEALREAASTALADIDTILEELDQ